MKHQFFDFVFTNRGKKFVKAKMKYATCLEQFTPTRATPYWLRIRHAHRNRKTKNLFPEGGIVAACF